LVPPCKVNSAVTLKVIFGLKFSISRSR